MMSPESNGEPEPVVTTPGAKRSRSFGSVDDETSSSLNLTEGLQFGASELLKVFGYGAAPCAKRARQPTDEAEDAVCSDGEGRGGAKVHGCGTGSAASDRSSSSSCPTVLYGASAKCDTLNNNSPTSGNHNIGNNAAAGGGGGSSCDNNNSIGEMDESKFSEFSKFLADSEKDESMATILELLHDNYGLIQRYASGYDCKHEKCQYESLHEHFHCHDTFCRGKVLYKKYEIIRHLKWHKKRKESLKYGFYRFSSSDDCSIQYGACQHNYKHTHYHCVHENCDKVYISTSDVQMHANYHRKHEAIVKNGFQRFRATEECNTDHCAFRAQRTTHFHCRRENCKYTFKNKADMEKHKTYHLKDEMLLRDGYKKFLKTEDCTYKDCRFSRVCNHIHCMHENCHYVLHSSGQLLSHKRKHERMDTEVDYRRFQMVRSLLSKLNPGKAEDSLAKPVPGDAPREAQDELEESISPGPVTAATEGTKNPFLDLLAVMAEITFRTLPLQMMYHMRLQMLQSMGYEHVFAPENVEMLRSLSLVGPSFEEAYLNQLYGGLGGPSAPVDQSCSPLVDRSPAAKRKYKVEMPCEVPELVSPSDVPLCMKKEPLSRTPPRSKLLSNPSVDYRLLKRDDSGPTMATTPTSSRRSPLEAPGSSAVDRDRSLLETANFLQFSSSKTLFNRKRGRPRKNHVMEVYNNAQDSPQAIFTSFKLEKSDSKPPSEATVPLDSLCKDSDRNVPSSRQYLPGSHHNIAGVGQLGGPDSAGIFGNFSQLLERHMREVKHEPVATVTQGAPDQTCRDKSRSHLKCVVCENLFETFADIKNHECHGDRAAIDKPLLAFPPVATAGPPGLIHYRGSTYCGPGLPEPSRATVLTAGMGAPHHQPKDVTSLVKTAGTFFPDVNANKVKFS
ncbi:uncharacterized protein LOC131208821 [Anopheles bellator]|uniref:uncharacterized protein LOC131208821 n=1 Tax=Anopheles bellator TaxID=139047 RepID=UPI002648E87F|nr:uncharacterized protein LOC131208821 [Anopheles bellator]XP_058057704.1 uncharacterized protein LOC131208821 [Anopheles bellator]